MDQFGNPYEIYQYESATLQAPVAHNGNVLVPSNYVKRVDIQYDPTSKNVSSTKMVDNVNTSYLWGYNNEFPIAMAVNANVADIAASSFESDGKGNWTYTGQPSNDMTVKTGTHYYKLSASNITKSLTAGKYKLEYWGKGTITLSGGTITTVRTSPADADGWILYEKEINVTTTVTLTIGGGTGFIDELRLYPSTAQMTTYTYDVVKGITSVTDPNNFTKYYDYDAFGRLKWIKDHNKHIIKTYDYHYKNN
jgi:YD repeat-containing protein